MYRCEVVGLLAIFCIASLITTPYAPAARTVTLRFAAEWRQGYDFSRHAVIEINGVEKHKWVFTHSTDQTFQDTIDTTVSNTIKAYAIYARDDDKQSRYYGNLWVDGREVASSDDAGPLTPLVHVIPSEGAGQQIGSVELGTYAIIFVVVILVILLAVIGIAVSRRRPRSTTKALPQSAKYTRYCGRCGAKIGPEDRFCPECGEVPPNEI